MAILGNQKKSLKESKSVRMRNLSDENIHKIREDLDKENWLELLVPLQCNESFEHFHKILCESIDRHAPEETKKMSYRKQIRDPWITRGILTSLTKQKRLYQGTAAYKISCFHTQISKIQKSLKEYNT